LIPVQFTRLRLSGFKSFVQPAELLIEPGLTGVVGPNGCGKSNLVEALRWVMGESSARGLRGGEMDDVIFAGTAARPAYDLAEVTLQLRGADMSAPGQGQVDEIELCRRIGRGVGSSYRLNGRETRARDVQILFADAASGARSAAIVSQGQIGALVEAKPAERRRILEDAAGVAGLQARRHEAELRLQAAEANLGRVHDLIVTLSEQHERLRKQARQAARYRELSAAFRETEAALLAGRWRAARAALVAAEAALEQARERVAGSARAVADLRQERDATAADVQRLRAAEASLGADLARLGERLQAAANEVAQLEARRRALIEREAQTAHDLDHARATLADAGAMRARLEVERAALLEQSEARDREIEHAAAEETARGALEAAEACFRQALAALADLEAREKQLRQRHEQVARDRTSLEAAERQAQGDRSSLGDDQGDPADDDDAAGNEVRLEAVLQAAEEAEAALSLAEERGEKAARALTQAEQHRQELRQRRDALAAARRRLEDDRRRLIERRRELDGRRERLDGRRAQLDEKAAEREERRSGLKIADREMALAAAEPELTTAGAQLAAARESHAFAEEKSDRARKEAATISAAVDRLGSELRAIAELCEPDGAFARIIDAVAITEGYADAVAAALGDELLASLDQAAPSYWCGIADHERDLPRLPPGLRSLAEFVTAPGELAQRLAQIGVVEPDRAEVLQAQLAQGQRLVSLEGGLWRWDGFVRRPDGSRSAAARLRQQARRQALERALIDRRGDLEAHQAGLERSTADGRAAAAALEEAKAALAACEAARETLRLELAEARSADAALLAELAALADETASIEAAQSELAEAVRSFEREQAALESTAAELADGAEVEAALALADTAYDDCEAVDRNAKAARVEARERAAGARRAATAAQGEVERWHAKMRAAASALQERARVQARLDAELARIDAERRGLDQAEETLAAALAESATAIRGAGAELAEAEADLERHRAGHAAAAAEQARGRDRRMAEAARLQELTRDIALWRERSEAGHARLREFDERRAALQVELSGLAEAPAGLAQQEHALEAQLAEAKTRQQALERQRADAESELASREARLELAEAERIEAREAGARLEAQLERARAEDAAAETAWRERAPSGPVEVPREPPDPGELALLEERLAKLAASRERLGPVNLRAVDEAAELEIRLQTLQTERDELTGAIERLRRAIASLNREGRERLRAAFAQVEQHFEALFVRLFGGGQARLALTDLEDPLAAGLELAASPPGKKLQSLSLLSGGEKALTALALVFAVFLTRPSPLCVLDEVDAPLDDANVERLGDLLEELAEGTRTRFVVVTHHPLTMARMDRLYGVTMLERGVSQLVSVDLGDAMALRATA